VVDVAIIITGNIKMLRQIISYEIDIDFFYFVEVALDEVGWDHHFLTHRFQIDNLNNTFPEQHNRFIRWIFQWRVEFNY
jgi:hypothetical protein